MASFEKQLEKFLVTAQAQGVLDAASASRLAALASERERDRGWLSLGGALGQLGAAATMLGIMLLVAANWRDIADWVKIGGLLLLLGGAHGAGLWIQWTGKPYPRFAEALHFIGAGLFLAGLALVGQIYHLRGNVPGALLAWLAAITPLAVLLRSPAITGLAILAAWLWLHAAAADPGSALHTRGFTAYLMLSVGMGLALISLQTALGRDVRRIQLVMRGAGQLMLFYGVYMLGFFRRISTRSSLDSLGEIALPAGALLLGVTGILVGWNRLAPEAAWLRPRLRLLLIVLVATCAAALLLDAGILPRGARVSVVEFGSTARFDVAAVIVSAAAWVVWFLFALWLVAYGALSRQKNFVNLGVLGFGLGIITRFIDLIGGLAETGTAFVLGGIVLLGTAWGMERWRRTLVDRMKAVA